MAQQKALFSKHAVVNAGIIQKSPFQSDPPDAPRSRSPHSFQDISSSLKSNCVIALSSLAAEGEGKFYAVRCLVAGVWSLQVQADLQPYDPSVQFVVVNQNGKLGFRSAIAEGRLLCCSRQYHLGFERWQMDCQEAWTLQGSSLSNCTLRNDMYKLTLNIRITVLAEPTDLLGNPRITSALMTTSFFWHNSTATLKSNSASSSYVKEGGKSSDETPRLFSVGSGTNTKLLNLLNHQRDGSNRQEVRGSSTELYKTGALAKPISSSVNLHESKGTSVPRCGEFTFSSSVKTDSLQNASLHIKGCTEEDGKLGSHRVPVKGSVTDWKPKTPSRNEGQLSSFSVTTRIFPPESHSDTHLQERIGNRVSEAVVSPCNASTSDNPRKVRKWKRNQKIFSVDPEGNRRPTSGLKRSQEPFFIDITDADGTFISPGSSSNSVSPRNGGHSPKVVIKRQSGFLASKGDSDVSPRISHCNAKGKGSENSGERIMYSKNQMEAALSNLQRDTAQHEKEKVIHWKLQAAVSLLKTETERKLSVIARGAFEEAYARTFSEDMKRRSWLSQDLSPVKRAVSSKLQRNSTSKTSSISSHQNKRPWTCSFKRVSPTKEEDTSLAVSHMRRNSSSRLQMLLKLWFFLPVPLLSLAYVTFIYRRKKNSDG